MKVLIHNSESNCYLSANGRWVTNAAEARDFHSVLPAYNYAKLKTSGQFQVVLYCSDDGSSTTIVEGNGVARSGAAAPTDSIHVTVVFGGAVENAPIVSTATSTWSGAQELAVPASRFCFN